MLHNRQYVQHFGLFPSSPNRENKPYVSPHIAILCKISAANLLPPSMHARSMPMWAALSQQPAENTACGGALIPCGHLQCAPLGALAPLAGRGCGFHLPRACTIHTTQPHKRTRFCGVSWCALCLRVPFTPAPVGLRAPSGAHCVRFAHKCAPASREGCAFIRFRQAAPRPPATRGSV